MGSLSTGGGYLRTKAHEGLRLVPLLSETKELFIDVAGLLSAILADQGTG